ncbi:MAG: hypothetical protein ALECFALPRED_003414 [Alectoria fallacina]|uniref:Uncharacterized protein n=1 Tax=Alectoria fallacina TaxID=1903189 RepID=A0A8H3FM38_9LECA|nr:MAG: hypothetical protein ALECFALPRED_003414 [Alectoria fallacina]
MPQLVFFPLKKKPKTLPTTTSSNDAKDTPMGGKVSGVAVREILRGNSVDTVKMGRKTQRTEGLKHGSTETWSRQTSSRLPRQGRAEDECWRKRSARVLRQLGELKAVETHGIYVDLDAANDSTRGIYDGIVEDIDNAADTVTDTLKNSMATILVTDYEKMTIWSISVEKKSL